MVAGSETYIDITGVSSRLKSRAVGNRKLHSKHTNKTQCGVNLGILKSVHNEAQKKKEKVKA